MPLVWGNADDLDRVLVWLLSDQQQSHQMAAAGNGSVETTTCFAPQRKTDAECSSCVQGPTLAEASRSQAAPNSFSSECAWPPCARTSAGQPFKTAASDLVVIASDLIYQREVLPALMELMVMLCGLTPTVILAYEERAGIEQEFQAALNKAHLKADKVGH